MPKITREAIQQNFKERDEEEGHKKWAQIAFSDASNLNIGLEFYFKYIEIWSLSIS